MLPLNANESFPYLKVLEYGSWTKSFTLRLYFTGLRLKKSHKKVAWQGGSFGRILAVRPPYKNGGRLVVTIQSMKTTKSHLVNHFTLKSRVQTVITKHNSANTIHS